MLNNLVCDVLVLVCFWCDFFFYINSWEERLSSSDDLAVANFKDDVGHLASDSFYFYTQ